LLTDYSIASEDTSQQLILTSPLDNTTYRIDPSFDRSAQQISLEAIGQGFSQVDFYADGILIGTSNEKPYQAWWALSEGSHRFWVEGVTSDGKITTSPQVMLEVVK
jgi:hypothetical protein